MLKVGRTLKDIEIAIAEHHRNQAQERFKQAQATYIAFINSPEADDNTRGVSLRAQMMKANEAYQKLEQNYLRCKNV